MSSTKSPSPSLSSLVLKVNEICLKAGHLVLTHYQGSRQRHQKVLYKGDQTPVTEADLQSHRLISEALHHLTPTVPVVSEEDPVPADFSIRKNWSEFWLVDPLDGTHEFVEGTDEFTINLALIRNGVPVIGVTGVPALGLLYSGYENGGSWKFTDPFQKGERIYSTKADLTRPVTLVESRSHGTAELNEWLQRNQIQIKERIPVGSSFKFCKVAEGSADLYPRVGTTMEWDVAAGDCLYRNSARVGQHRTSFTYNKPDFKNGPFVIGTY